MKKLALFAIVSVLAATPAAFAGSVCPNSGAPGGFTNTITNVPGPRDWTCGANSAVNLYIASNADYAKMTYSASDAGYPGYMDFANITGINAAVQFTAQQAGDQPFYALSFFDPAKSVGQAAAGDQILMLEFQPSTVSGGDMAVDPATTLFNLYDNTTGQYLEGGQSDANSIDEWLLLDPALKNDPIAAVFLAEGLAGGCGGACSESLTINTLDINASPEPSSLLLLGTGLLGVAGELFRRSRLARRLQK